MDDGDDDDGDGEWREGGGGAPKNSSTALLASSACFRESWEIPTSFVSRSAPLKKTSIVRCSALVLIKVLTSR